MTLKKSVSKEALRSCADQVVQLNYNRHLIFRKYVGAWRTHCDENHRQSSSSAFTICEEYDDLLEMGTSIIAPLMVEYYSDWAGYWWELLHEIIHGRKTGAKAYRKGELYIACEDWFNQGEHHDAREYTSMDDILPPLPFGL